VTVKAVQDPGLSVTKSSATTGVDAAGAKISYSFKVTNTGNVTLTKVALTDTQSNSGEALDAPGISCPAPDSGSTVASLAPGASVTCTGTYTVTTADVNAGKVSDTASAAATDAAGTQVASAPSQLSIAATAPAQPTAPAAQPSPIVHTTIPVTG
jgi:uncharacterized repeat protein (TIGR01451 family)